MEKQHSPKNKTLQIDTKEIQGLKERLITLSDSVGPDQILNKTICGNLFDITGYLPKAFADLIIIDPPYNLSKNFSGMKFFQKKDDTYLEYVRSWFPSIMELLKPNALSS